MAAFNKFWTFVGDLGLKYHDLNADTLKIYLTNTAPNNNNMSIKGNLTGATEANNYAAADVTNTWSQTAGVGTMVATDVVWTATGDVGAFRYVVLYNDTSTTPADPLIGWWDYGSSITLHDTETFTVDFAGNQIMTIE